MGDMKEVYRITKAMDKLNEPLLKSSLHELGDTRKKIKLERGHFKTGKRKCVFTQWIEKFWNLLLQEVVRQIVMAGPRRI